MDHNGVWQKKSIPPEIVKNPGKNPAMEGDCLAGLWVWWANDDWTPLLGDSG